MKSNQNSQQDDLIMLRRDPEESREELNNLQDGNEKSGLGTKRKMLELGHDLGEKETQGERIESLKEGAKQPSITREGGQARTAQTTDASFFTKQTGTSSSSISHKGGRAS